MKLNGRNIIFDEDITMTGKNLGKKLSDLLGELDSKTSRLEKYLKWIYNYGGVGGSGGGGGGGSDSSGFILYSTLNGIHLNNQVISLGKAGSYVLRIEIQKPQGASFSVTYDIKDLNGVSKFNPTTVVLSIENNYQYETTLNLDDNATITVTAKDSVYATTKQESASYVTKSYNVDINFVTDSDGSGGGNEALGSEIPTADAMNKGLNVTIDYNIAVTYKEFRYKIIFNTGKEIVTIDPSSPLYRPVNNTDTNGKLVFDLVKEVGHSIGWEPTDENAGYYSVQVIVEILIEGSSTSPIEKSINFNLIPPNLYLLVSPARGTIYTERQNTLTNVYPFSTGAITFNVEPYRGSDRDAICEIACILDNGDEELAASEPVKTKLRSQTPVTVYATTPGWNKVLFRLECGGVYYPGPTKTEYKEYWFYVKQPDTSISWYTLDRSGTYNYFRGGLDQVNNKNMTDLIRNTISGGSYFRQTSNSDRFVIRDLAKPSTTSYDFCTMFHFGLQYNEVNEDNAPIFTAVSEDGKNLTVTQNTVTFDTESFKYYLPKTDNDLYGITDECRNNFHLLSLVFRYVKSNGYDHYYEVIIYVDGVIEGALNSYITKRPVFNTLTIEKINSIFNLVELSYPTKELDENNTPKIEDLNIYQYFLKYKSDKVVNFEEVSFGVEKEILSKCRSVKVTNWGDVICDLDTVDNIAANLSVPTMVLTIENTSGIDYWKNYLEGSYEETSTDGGDNIPVAIKWSPGNGNNLKEIICEYTNSSFFAKIQGSSTKSYKCKNYSLTLTNNDESEDSDVYLYSPNFSTSDTTTFLPEQTFTLKADVVDSSHSNNTSIGKFVNNITTPFNITKESETLGKYVRNCLDGFPFVLFLQFINRDENRTVTSELCYFQGVYNFNLGRDSFFNLGYKDLSAFCNSQGRSELETPQAGGFLFHRIPAAKNSIKDGLIVAEIQGNSPFFDFSQYDDDILYQSLSIPNEAYMFDDFVHGSNLGNTLTITKRIIKNMIEKVSFAGGYLFDYIRKTFSNSDDDKYGYEFGYEAIKSITNSEEETLLVPANQVPNYRRQYGKRLDDGGKQEFYLKKYVSEAGTRSHLEDLIIGNIDDNIAPLFDFTSLSEYYTICMAFGLVDSVQKNMNIKCWNADASTSMATFYAAFYDMDTSLGINNQGLDVSYFAFSDYWNYTDTTSPGSTTTVPSPVTIYRDFSPKLLLGKEGSNLTNISTGDFYDTASSYLFAVAKYARLIINSGEFENYTFNWPRQLWAKWRSAKTGSLDKTVGCLVNADEFMNNYFANNLGKVSVPLINMNYRNKYLVRVSEEKVNGTTFNAHNFEKFTGTRVAKTRDWLSSRLHILDAYFNLANSVSVYQAYDDEGNYTNINTSSSGQAYLMEPSVDLSGPKLNPDVTILRDIFNEGDSKGQGSGNLDFTVKAKEYSPLIITATNQAFRYLLGGTNNYNVVLKLNGTQTYTFGGSSAWTYLDSIDSFGFTKLYVNSKYLTKLSGSSNSYTMSVDENSIRMPSLKELTLTGKFFAGNLNIDGSNLPNLDKIDVSNSQINLSVNSSNFTELNIANMDVANSASNSLKTIVSVISCPKLSRISFGSGNNTTPATRLKSCQISPVPTALCKTTSTTNASGGLSINYTAIESLSLSNDEDTGGYSRISIQNDKYLKEVDLKGFAQVYINNCSSLSKIVISENEHGDKLKSLTIMNCGNIKDSEDIPFSIGVVGTEDGCANLSGFKNLQTLKISGCNYLEKVFVDTDSNHEIKLPSEAFKDNPKLISVSGGDKNIVITGDSTFYNCPKFILKKSSEDTGTGISIRVDASVTDLSNTFRAGNNGGSIDYFTAKNFIKYSIPDNNVVTNISYMFYQQSRMSYSESNLSTDLQRASDWVYTIDMSKFKKVTDVSYCFAWCSGIQAWHYAFWNFGGDVNTITATYYHTKSTSTITAPIDILKNVITKINIIGFSDVDGGWSYCKLKLLNPSTRAAYSEVKIKDFFHPGGNNHPNKVTALRNIGFENTTLDFNDTFDNWTSLTKIENFMWDKEYQGSNLKNFDELLNKDLPNLSSVYRSFNISNVNQPINLSTFCNWEQLLNKSANIFTGYYTSEVTKGTMNFTKYLLPEGLGKIVNCIRSGNITGIDCLFKKTVYITDRPEFSLGTLSTSSTEKIKSAVSAFSEFKIVNPDTTKDGIELIKDAVSRSTDVSNCSYIEFENIFRVLSKVTSMAHMFYSTKIGSPITYNFFNKRRKTSRTVYIPKKNRTLPNSTNPGGKSYDKSAFEDYFETATLNYYTYPTTGADSITSMWGIFSGCRWKENVRSFNPELEENQIEFDHIVRTGTNEIINDFGTKYYKESTRSTLSGESYIDIPVYTEDGILKKNTELLDTEDLEGGYTKTTTLSSTLSRDNFSVQEESVNRLFVAPDFFYACTSNCSVSSTFSNGSNHDECLEGIIPNNLMKNISSVSFQEMLTNLNIIPRKLWTEESDDKKVTVYYYVPRNFTKYTNLSNSFKFHFMLPDVEKRDADTGKLVYDKYYIFISNSIPNNTTSLSGSLPSTYTTGDNGLMNIPWPNPYTKDYKVHYNIFYNDNVSEQNGTEGINLQTQFKSLNPVKLVPSIIAAWCDGRIFSESTPLDTIISKRPTNITGTELRVIDTYRYSSGNSFISRYCILPKVNNATIGKFSNEYFIAFDTTYPLHLRNSQCSGSDSNSIRAYDDMYYTSATSTIVIDNS